MFQVIETDGVSKYCSIRDENGNTLLHLASIYGRNEHARKLIQVQSNTCNGDQLSVLHSILLYSQISQTIVDAENDEFKTPLHLAIEAGCVE